MSVLIVVAHPDDEVLGCGGTAAGLALQGVPVHTCILSGNADARRQHPTSPALQAHACNASRVLGLAEPCLGDFPNIAFNPVPHLELVRFIEERIAASGAHTIFTHHPKDLNDDHRHTSLACQAAARLFQRRPGMKKLRGLYFVEILSSTDWAFPANGEGFRPDCFFELGTGLLDRKIAALREYPGVMRDFPHPRSEEVLRALAACRGGQAGMHYAEAFQTAFRGMRPSEFTEPECTGM